jgi:hypothetical protein
MADRIAMALAGYIEGVSPSARRTGTLLYVRRENAEV